MAADYYKWPHELIAWHRSFNVAKTLKQRVQYVYFFYEPVYDQ